MIRTKFLLVLGLLTGGCGSTARIPAHDPSPAPQEGGPDHASSDAQGAIAAAGEDQVPGAPAMPDLLRERSLLEEAAAAVQAQDPDTARDKRDEAIARLRSRTSDERDAAWLELVDRAGRDATNAKDPSSARTALELSLETRLLALPDDHPDLQKTRTNLAIALKALGDLAGARALQEKVLETRAGTLPSDHPDILRAQHSLALTLYTLRDLEGARALQESVVEVRARTLADDHSTLLLARSNLALTLKALGDLAGARAQQEKVLEVRTRTLPDEHPDLTTTRRSLGTTLYTLGDLAGARALQEKVLEVLSRSLADDDPDLQSARQSLSTTLYMIGDLAGAQALQEKVLEIRTQALPEDHTDLQHARSNLALTIKTLGDLAGARDLEERVLKAHLARGDEDHANVQRARTNLAATMYLLGRLDDARALQESVLETFSRTLPDDHLDLQMARSNLSATMSALGNLARARELQTRVLEVRLEKLPSTHPEVLDARNNLAQTMSACGELPEAQVLQEQVLATCLETLPEGHPRTQMARNNLAATLHKLGNLASARALQEVVLEIHSRSLPDDHAALQAARANLANTRFDLGDIAGARALQERVLEIASRSLPDDHPSLQDARLNLAGTLKEFGLHADARALEERVLVIRTAALPDDHPALQIARGNLAWTLKVLGELEEARALQAKVLEISSRTLPDMHVHLQMHRLALASTLYALADLDGARRLQEHALASSSRNLPDEHSVLQMARWSLAVTTAALALRGRAASLDRIEGEEGPRKRFADLARAHIAGLSRAVRTALLSGGSREAEERCFHLLPELGRALSFAAGYGVFPLDAELERAVFEVGEAARGAALVSARLARSAHGSERSLALHERLRTASDEVVRLARSSDSLDELDAAIDRRDAAEGELLADARENLGIGPDPVDFVARTLAEAISDHDAIVAYRRYAREEPQDGWGTIASTESLCAFVLRSDDRLDRVELGPIEPIERAVIEYRHSLGVASGRGVGVPAQDSGEIASIEKRGRALRERILDPLLPSLVGIERIVLALDDTLHLVPFEALPMSGSSNPAGLVGDHLRIETRCTLSELVWARPAPAGDGTLLALGGAAFDQAPRSRTIENLPDPEMGGPLQVASVLRGGAWEDGFGALAHSELEATGIAELFREAFPESAPAHVLVGRSASSAAFAELGPGARFLHLATHGWFAPESVRSAVDSASIDPRSGAGARMSFEERARGMSPMLLCGLALAGANLPDDAVGRTPGLITAEELSKLDLTDCELAVLSACDTNVGERRAGQGVASLQRALHMAGARSVITSLWKVPDEATKELMLDFYRRIWIQKRPKGQALWEAKRTLRDARNERGNPKYSTRDWAAWVLTGEAD